MRNHIFSSEAAKLIGIGVSTLRNYAVILEDKGYRFERGANNGRIFREADLQLITQMTEKIANEGMKVGEAAEAAVKSADSRIDEHPQPLEDKDAKLELLMEQIQQLEERQSKFAEINNQLTLQLERLTEKIEERERDQELQQRLQNTRDKKKRKGIAFFRPLTTLAGKK